MLYHFLADFLMSLTLDLPLKSVKGKSVEKTDQIRTRIVASDHLVHSGLLTASLFEI